MAAVANPYTEQLHDFSAGVGNARRGLTDLYKIRRKNLQKEWAGLSKTWSGGYDESRRQYQESAKALKGFSDQGYNQTAAVGYDTDDPAVQASIRALVKEGSSPYLKFSSTEQRAQGQWYKGYKGGELAEHKALSAGLKREEPAALSELEQGILDTQTNLQAQGQAFAQQQAYNASMQGWMNQMLGFQRQMAQGQMGAAGGGSYAAGKSSPNTAQWGQYGAQTWGVTVGGYRAKGSVPNSDHPKGLANDYMTGSNSRLGSIIANDFVNNATQRGVSYVIWYNQIWTPAQGWHPYHGPNPHTDHVHVSFMY